MEYILDNQARGHKTKVVIGEHALKELDGLTEGYTKTVVITDESAAKHCLPTVEETLGGEVEKIVLPDGEANKNLKFAEDVLRRLREAGFDRKSLVIGLGGGVIGDIAGFAASMYMRGIDWLMIPTTLIAQADASIGGKTGLNLGGYKNMIGSFWPPEAVLINPRFLDSLPERHLKNGLAEIIKMGFIADAQILSHVEKIDSLRMLGEDLDKASELAAKAKVQIVNSDMFEAGERKLLNFGHTVGHGLEAISLDLDEPLLHGEAVAIGVVAETKLAELEGICEPGLSDEVKETLQRFGLPTSYKHAVLGDILERIASDKKNIGSTIYWTLPKASGQGIFNHVAGEGHVRTAIESILV